MFINARSARKGLGPQPLKAAAGCSRTSGATSDLLSQARLREGASPEVPVLATGHLYHALAHYMTLGTTFAQAGEVTLKAATDLYGANSTEVQKVKESWIAVGVN